MGYSLNVVATEYRLIDNYTSKLDRIASGTQNFASKLESLLVATGRLAFTGLLAAGGAVLQFGIAAVKAHSDYENLKITLESLTGSAEKAAQKIAFFRKLAVPATNTFSELAEAGTQLEAYGIRAEAVLPSLAKLAAAMKSNPQALQEGVRIFGEAAAGRILLARQLATVGLSKGQLEKHGLKFDEDGKLLGSAKETMQTLLAVIEEKYGNIFVKMAHTTSSKLDNVRNAWEQILIKVGGALQKYLLPALDKLTAWFDAIEKSQGFDRFLQRMARNFVNFVVTIAEGFAQFQSALGTMRLLSGNFGGAFEAFSIAGITTKLAGEFAKHSSKFLGDIERANKPGGFAAFLEKAKEGIRSRVDISDPLGPNAPLFEPGQEPVEKDNTQKAIERNTRQTAESMSSFAGDLRRYVVGGGELAKRGITPVELAEIQGSHGHKRGHVTVHAPGASRKIQEALEEVANATHFEIMRQKPWGHTQFVR